MPLVERLKRRLSLARLRRAAQKSPSPATYGALAERLIAVGETEEALRAAQEGLESFPDAERLEQVRAFAAKSRSAGRLRKLKDDAARRPSPPTYAQLAQAYLDVGGESEALAVAAECAERFPLSETGCLVLGEIRAARFRRHFVARDALTAHDALQKAVRLDPQNATAHLRLAELAWLVGDAQTCRGHMRSALGSAPPQGDEQTFLDELDRAAAAELADAPSFGERAASVETERAFANDPSRFPRPADARAAAAPAPRGRVDADGVRDAMSALAAQTGVKNAVLLGEDGAPLAQFAGGDGLAADRFAELVKSVRDVADDATRRMDAGALVRAEIEGPGGNVTVARARGFTVALLYAEPLRAERACAVVQDFVDRALAAPRERARA